MSRSRSRSLDSVWELKYPLRNQVYEAVKAHQNITDRDLLNELNKNGADVSMRGLNKVLMQLEILGLVTVRWIGKDRRRIEVAESRRPFQEAPEK